MSWIQCILNLGVVSSGSDGFLHAFSWNFFTYIVIYKRQRAQIFNQDSSHLHEDLQQLDTGAQERRHSFVPHPDILCASTHELNI